MNDQLVSFQICPRDTWVIMYNDLDHYDSESERLQDAEFQMVHGFAVCNGVLVPVVVMDGSLVSAVHDDAAHGKFIIGYGPRPTLGEVEGFLKHV